jgi:hypothetical protein
VLFFTGSTTIKTFASVLGQQFEMQQMQSQDCLDEESSCVMILNWLRTHENNVQELIDILRGFNDQSIQGKLSSVLLIGSFSFPFTLRMYFTNLSYALYEMTFLLNTSILIK